MSCATDFRNNSELSEQAKTFGKFLNYRSNFDANFLQKYDTLALQTPTGPNPTITEHYCNNCGQPQHTKVQNLQNPYSPCMKCGSIQRIQEQAQPKAYIGRSSYDMAFDAKYDTLSLNSTAGPNPDQTKNN